MQESYDGELDEIEGGLLDSNDEEGLHIKKYDGKLSSCAAIKEKYLKAQSGLYDITLDYGRRVKVYCEMRKKCGEKGWTRLALWDAKKTGCPNGLVTYSDKGTVHACGRKFDNFLAYFCSESLEQQKVKNYFAYSCVSQFKIPSNSQFYSKVCGKVIGYQFGSTTGFYSAYFSRNVTQYDIHDGYLDGVIITLQSGEPIWTFASGNSENGAAENFTGCTCPSNIENVRKYLGDHYFCESGTPNYKGVMLYHKDPLWDGEKCNGDEKACCNKDKHPYMPYFKRVFSKQVNDNFELWMCGDMNIRADTPISRYELYVK